MKWALLIAWTLVTACGGDSSLSADEVAKRLAALPGVTVQEKPTRNVGYTYFVVHFTQPIDHDNPSAGTFQQEVSLLHRDTRGDVPMIVYTTGYSDYMLDGRAELTALFAANQVSIEHRYFGESRPAAPDWQKLTIKQAADDEHDIIAALRKVYDGAFITTGASKGGMTAIFHRRFYPDDVEGTVPYVAPISFGAPDARYDAFVDTLGPTDCHAAVQAAAVEMLKNRRAALVQRASVISGASYTRVTVDAAVEEAVLALEWQFWQYVGVGGCATVPTAAADDDTLFTFLQKASPVNSDSDYAFFDAYVYQAYAQLGYPANHTDYLTDYVTFHDADYAGELPTALPAYDAAAMQDIDSFVKTDGDRLLFVYGGWDPWTGGKFDLGAAKDSALYIQDQGTHGAKLARLATTDRDAAAARIAAWTGATADFARLTPASSVAPPRMRVRRLTGR